MPSRILSCDRRMPCHQTVRRFAGYTGLMSHSHTDLIAGFTSLPLKMRSRATRATPRGPHE
jgi:hypothetical protein